MAKNHSIQYTQLQQVAMRLVAWMMLLCSMTACIEEFNAELPSSETHMLVVEGSIISDEVCPFYLSYSFSLNDSLIHKSDNYVSNANVVVKGSDGSSFQGNYLSPGEYEVAVGHLNLDASYSLEIDVDGQHYSTIASLPLVTPAIDSICFDQPRADLEVDVMVTPVSDASGNEVQYFCWTYDEWWEIRTPYHASFIYDPKEDAIVAGDPLTHQGWHHALGHEKIIGSNKDYKDGRICNLRLYSRGKDADCFEYLYYTRIKQRAISLQEYEFEKLSAQQNEEMGGLFTPQPSELPSNVVCTSDASFKAIGFIGVSANVSTQDRYLFGATIGYRSPYRIISYDFKDTGFKNYLEAYQNEYRVLTWNPENTTWTKRYLMDCTVSPWFCTLEKPDFWQQPTK